jgi:crotonobetaine/carnitine-CoA ligase
MAFREIFEKRVERDGKKPFVFFRDQAIDYVTLQGKVHKAANLLRELGVRKGDPVCLFLPNCLEFLYLWFGLAEIGGVMVPLDVNLRGGA